MNAPDPILTDESNAFAHDTMIRRVPETANRIREVNPDYAPLIHDELARLHDDIQSGAPIPMLPAHAPDYDIWLPQWELKRGEGWLNAVWYFAETYFYRQVIRAVRWWETQRDPFAPIKREEVEGEGLWRLLERALAAETLHDLLMLDLWGNRIDLSFAASLERGAEDIGEDDLIADDSAQAVEQIEAGEGPAHLIADNAGTELAIDLALVDRLLREGVPQVVVHCKMHPTFVSDATVGDIHSFIARADRGATAAFARRLREAFEEGRLRLYPHLYWNSGLFFWQMPEPLRRAFSGARLVISKGDANYRRLVGDAMWPPATPFEQALDHWHTPLVALRTLKSDPILGLEPGTAERLDALDPAWRVNGQRGIIQMRPGL